MMPTPGGDQEDPTKVVPETPAPPASVPPKDGGQIGWLELFKLWQPVVTVVVSIAALSVSIYALSRGNAQFKAQQAAAQRLFNLNRTSYFIERFHRPEMLEARADADRWLRVRRGKEDTVSEQQVRDMLHAANLVSADFEDPRQAEDAAVFVDLRLIANFFQELGAAFDNESLDEKYLWQVFGSLVTRYHRDLAPFLKGMRNRANNQDLYEDFDQLADKMLNLKMRFGSAGP